MGTGKSSVGRLAAKVLRFDFIDTDHLIETRAGKSISAIFAEQGETAFRAIEAGVVRDLEEKRDVVIATGGGLPVHGDNLERLKVHSLVVCLWSSPETIWHRVRAHSHRPLLQDPDPMQKIKELLTLREPFYKQADVLVNTELRSVHEVAQIVVHQFHIARSAT